MNTKIIKLDINKKLYETISAKQGDTESRFLLFHIFDSSLPFDLREKSVRVYGIKPDDTKVFNDLVINDAEKGYCTLELTNQILAIAGLVKLELVIYNGNKKLSSIPFVLNVISSLNSDDAVVSTNEFTALMNGFAALSEYDIYKSNAKQVPGIKEEVSNLSSQLDTVTNKEYIKYKNNDKAYVCIMFDDFRNDLDKVFKIFKEYDIPLSVAIPSNVLMNKANYQQSVDLLKEIQMSGGEVLAHGYSYEFINANSTFQDAYKEIILPKEELSKCGFNVNGWVRPGGNGALANLNGFQYLVENNYLYAFDVDDSSLLMKFGGTNRLSLPNYTNSSEFIARMESAITHKNFVSYYAHSIDGTDGNLTETILRECLQYLKNNKDRIEVITPKDYYDKFIEGGNRQERINNEVNFKNSGIAIQEINNKINSYAFPKNLLDVNIVNSDGSLNSKWTYDNGGTGSSNRYYLENGSEFRFTFYATDSSANGTGIMKLSYTTNKVYIRQGDTFKTGFYARNLFGTMTIELNIVIKYKNETDEITEFTKTIDKNSNLTLTCFDFVSSKTNADVDYIRYEVTVNRPTSDTNNSLVYFSLPYLNVINKNNQYGVLL